MVKSIGYAAAALGLCIGGSASAQQVGDWVLAPWRDSTALYPGVVIALSPPAATIRFDDGTTETRHVSDIYVYDWGPGSRIACRWSDGNWYNATILWAGGDGYSLRIEYDDDGVVEDAVTGRCRTRD